MDCFCLELIFISCFNEFFNPGKKLFLSCLRRLISLAFETGSETWYPGTRIRSTWSRFWLQISGENLCVEVLFCCIVVGNRSWRCIIFGRQGINVQNIRWRVNIIIVLNYRIVIVLIHIIITRWMGVAFFCNAIEVRVIIVCDNDVVELFINIVIVVRICVWIWRRNWFVVTVIALVWWITVTVVIDKLIVVLDRYPRWPFENGYLLFENGLLLW